MLQRLMRHPLTRSQSDELICQLVEHVFKYVKPIKTILFGSAARGQLTNGSDIDLALVFETEEQCRTAKKALLTKPNPINWPVDYLFFPKEVFERSEGVCAIIREEGLSLGDKS